MSGGYKYVDVMIDPSVGVYDPTLACVVLGSILAQRAAEAAVEAYKRLEAEEGSLAANLNAVKAISSPVAESVRFLLAQQKENILPADHSVLCRRLTVAEEAARESRTHVTHSEAVMELARIESDIKRAVARKESEDVRTGRSPAMTVFRARYEELKRQAGSLLGDAGPGPLGPAGAAAVLKTALAAAGGALQTNNESTISAHIDKLEALVNSYEDSVREAVEATKRSAALSDQAAGESTAILAGLRADEVVMRWHAASVEELERDLAEVTTAGRLDPSGAIQKTAAARERSAKIVQEANSAQVKADQRDYIARSISSTLSDMGFVVGEPVEEHPGHPATASIVHAASATGKAIAVSVPIEGQVWYNVEGYVKTVEALVGGGHAAACDEAEDVIEQMHEALEEEFHLQMGELQWEGKDPNRKLRAAKSVPQSGSSSRSTS